MQSIGRGKKLVRALAPAEVHAIYRNFIQLKELAINDYDLTKTFESRSPSEFPPFEVGNSKRWMI
jgi:hypothetical protein